jgi:hypothetical protein
MFLFDAYATILDFVLSQDDDKVTDNYSAEVGELSYCVTTPVSLS